MMRLFRFDDPTHGEASELLPWFVNETLTGAERARVERHLTECVACRNEAESLRALQAFVAEDDADPAVTQAFCRVNARLQEMESALSLKRIQRWIAVEWHEMRPWVRGVVLAQSVLLALLTAALLGQPAPQYYRTLSATPARASLDNEVVVVFDSALSERDLHDLLLRMHARIVDGPSPVGAYTLEVAPGEQQAALAVLRREGSVLFAEPAPAVGRSPQ